eukprot:COSAG05_NODE_4231_length_1612_cov_3.775281_1_plen_98_part_00
MASRRSRRRGWTTALCTAIQATLLSRPDAGTTGGCNGEVGWAIVYGNPDRARALAWNRVCGAIDSVFSAGRGFGALLKGFAWFLLGALAGRFVTLYP